MSVNYLSLRNTWIGLNGLPFPALWKQWTVTQPFLFGPNSPDFLKLSHIMQVNWILDYSARYRHLQWKTPREDTALPSANKRAQWSHDMDETFIRSRSLARMRSFLYGNVSAQHLSGSACAETHQRWSYRTSTWICWWNKLWLQLTALLKEKHSLLRLLERYSRAMSMNF
jgi:hypothetical protein